MQVRPATRAGQEGEPVSTRGSSPAAWQPGGARRPTVRDVAAAAGVATSTVSRVFSAPDRISEPTRQHVLAVATRLGYRPNPIARALPRGQTMTLALLVPDITNPFFFDLIRGAERQAAAAGYTLVLADAGESAEAEGTHLDRLADSVDGLLLASSRLPAGRIERLMADHPVVVVNRKVGDLPAVVVDNNQGMRQAVDHLASLGHRRIAYVAGPEASWSDRTRWRALQTAARRVTIDTERIGPFAPTRDGGTAAADACLLTGATAVVAFNDLLAIGILRRLADRGVAVPAELSVLGSDDIFGADICSPALTTIAADVEQGGRAAIDLLLSTRADPESTRGRRIVLPTHLTIRASTGSAPSVRNPRQAPTARPKGTR